ncbi:MAG: NAD-dependent epimerase [Amycolatopsis sp.]|jgi:putative NADH-flavin reductase|uniref:NAD(P)-dependent oxidoreductase n=1 Tax=Amycolatopsis sp. TaxID=37632 RepID=UPI002609CA2D|nr:NAD(P)H-binding protein [Amycolatopsis sp.]MCU1685830.1 NAD-dependent epimerase [Amycolatopsis sp.]
MSKVVILGASGYAGGHIANELVDRGHTVVAVARDTSKLPARPNFSAVSGSAYDTAFVGEVTEGADVIVVSIPSIPPDGPELKDVLPDVLAVAGKVGARLAVVGGTGSLFATEGGPRVYEIPEWPAEYLGEALAHARALDVLRAHDGEVDWFYVSPPMGFGSWNPGVRTGAYRVGTDLLLKDAEGNSQISGADMAVAFADEIETPKHHKTRFTVGY